MINSNINSNLTRRSRGPGFPVCAVSAPMFSKPVKIGDKWFFLDKIGKRNGVLESNCLLGDNISIIQFPTGLESTAFTYFDGTIDQAGVTDVLGQWLIPNLVKVGNIRFETIAPYANWFLCDESEGIDLFNRVDGGSNASILNLSTNWTTDYRFTSFQNEVGYSEYGGIGSAIIGSTFIIA